MDDKTSIESDGREEFMTVPNTPELDRELREAIVKTTMRKYKSEAEAAEAIDNLMALYAAREERLVAEALATFHVNVGNGALNAAEEMKDSRGHKRQVVPINKLSSILDAQLTPETKPEETTK